MTGALRLTIATPTSLLVDCPEVVALRAEDESGAFGILPGHADFLTVLPPSVVRWRLAEGAERVCALSAGVLRVSGGGVAIAAREAVPGGTLADLAGDVRSARESQTDAERRARAEQTRLHAQAVRQLMRYLVPDGGLPSGGDWS